MKIAVYSGDYDGDIQATTDNQVFLRCRYDNLPITYSKSNVKKKKIKESNLYKADLDSFNTDIGGITNYSTSFYDVLNKYYDLLIQEPNNEYYKKCYDEIIERLKITRKQQGNAIDRAKGIKADKYPSTWINRQKITPEDSLDVIKQKNFLNDICGDKKPYFFKYRYMNSNHKHNEYKISRENYCYSTFKKHLKEVLTTPLEQLSEEEKEFIDIYYKYVPLIDYNSPMNKICHYMEDNLKELKQITRLKTPIEVIDLMRTQVITSEEKIDKIKELCRMYFEKRTELKKCQKTQDNKTLTNEDFSTIEQYAKHLREVAFEFFGDTEDIANTVIETCYIRNYRQSKSFAWNVFGKYIVQNIVRNSNSITTIPVKSEFGEIDYLYNKYKEVEVDLSDNI
jgi:hypothetical protein